MNTCKMLLNIKKATEITAFNRCCFTKSMQQSISDQNHKSIDASIVYRDTNTKY